MKIIFIFFLVSLLISCSTYNKTYLERKPASLNDNNCFNIMEQFNIQYEAQRLNSIKNNFTEVANRISNLRFNLEFYRDLGIGEIEDLINDNDQVIRLLKGLLEEANIHSEIISSQIKIDNQIYDYKVIKVKSLNESHVKLFKKVHRHIKKANVDFMTFDYFGNIYQKRAGGFSNSNYSITLTDNLLNQIFEKNILGHVFKHEVSHAYFKKKIDSDPLNIFLTRYQAIRGAVIQEGSFYKKYMSLEELYNYTNHFFWISELMVRSDFLDDSFHVESFFNSYDSFFVALEKIIDQSEYMMKFSIAGLEERLASTKPQYLEHWMILDDKRVGIAVKGEEVVTIRNKTELEVRAQEISKEIYQYLKDNNLPLVENNPTWSLQDFDETTKEALKEKVDRLKSLETDMFMRYINQDRKVQSLIPTIREETLRTQRMFVAVKEYYSQFSNGEISKEKMNKILKNFRYQTRMLAMTVRKK